MLLCIWINIYI